MEYISVIWTHQVDDDPVRLVSELDAERFERRKLEFFADGSVGVADGARADARTRLGTVAVPPLQEINEDRQFEGVSISQGEFERLWLEHASGA
jgi:hypothetical protein